MENYLPNLKDNIHKILHGRNKEKELLKGMYFFIADTPKYMKELGLIGDFFSVRYGVITRHRNKDEDHNLSEQNWLDLCDRIIEPFVITKNNNIFRIFTDVQLNNRNIIVCVSVKSAEKTLNVNAVSTAFGYRERGITGDIIYRANKITSKQAALLDMPNAMSLPPVQRLEAEHDAQLS